MLVLSFTVTVAILFDDRCIGLGKFEGFSFFLLISSCASSMVALFLALSFSGGAFLSSAIVLGRMVGSPCSLALSSCLLTTSAPISFVVLACFLDLVQLGWMVLGQPIWLS